MRRVVLTGAECTGKTTLAKALSGYYGEPWTGEYVREYVGALDRPLKASDLDTIAERQLAMEDQPIDQAKNLIIHDTSIFSSIVYAHHYFDTRIDWVNAAFLSRNYDLYFLCTPDGIEWQEDPGQRDSPGARAVLQQKFKEGLARFNLPTIELSGSPEIRFDEATKAIDSLLESGYSFT